MDTQTRHALKKDSFARATATSVSWIGGHRSGVLRSCYDCRRCGAGDRGAGVLERAVIGRGQALGAALDTYDSPLPVRARRRRTACTRRLRSGQAANKQFVDVAQKYGWLPEGSKAHYFAGITDQDLGQTASAETELKAAAGAWDHNLSNLAKLALAGLYHHTSRDAQAIDLYNQLAAKPSVTVSASVAQLDLADLYVAAGKQDQARALWAKVKDADKDGAAGSIAAQKLTGKQ